MKINLVTKLSTLGLLLASGALIAQEPAQAQFLNSESSSAIRAAISNVTVGGATSSYAIEVILPDQVYHDGGTYSIDLDYGTNTNPDETILQGATLTAGTISPITNSFEAAVADAIQSAGAANQFENVEAIIEKTVGPDGATVTID